MSANNSGTDGDQEKHLSESTVQTVPQNLTTIQSIQTVQSIQSVQNAVSSSMQNIQTAQTVTGQTATLVGKSISLELNSKLIMKPSIPSNIGSSSDNSKITNTFCPPTVRIIAPNMLSTIERQAQAQVQTSQQSQQIVTSIPSSFGPHVPRGPAAVANISTPRATVATPLVRAISTGQAIPISRPGNVHGTSTPVSHVSATRTHFCSPASVICRPRNPKKVVRRDAELTNPIVKALDQGTPIPTPKLGLNTTGSNVQWQPKTTSVVYAQPQRHPVPVVNRPLTRPVATAVYSSPQQQQQSQSQSQSQSGQPQPQQQQQQQQPRLVSPVGVQGRPVQATVVTATPSRLIAPVLQGQAGNIARLPSPARPTTPQVVTSMPQVSQGGRQVAQTIQPNQTNRSLNTTPINRIAVSAPMIGTSNRVATVTSVQTTVGRQLTINTAAGGTPGTVSRIVIPQQAIQQQQQQQQQQQPGTARVVQTVTPLANFSQVSRVIATTSTNAGVPGNVTRVAQTGPTSVARITSMSLHSLPLTPARAAPAPLKVTAQPPAIQTVQLKQATSTIQQQQQPQPQPQSQPQQVSTLQRTIGSVTSTASSASVVSQQVTQVQGQYIHQPTTYYSIEPTNAFPQYRQTSGQPVRLLVEQGFEEPLGKPNASPRPSILRKRDHDSSPGKGIAKNLVPVLASLPASSSASSPPGSPKGERDVAGNHSSGSTTVSATSSPGLDEEPEQLRIPINPTVEMSPRKKPRKQQLTGVELTESRCTEEEMQFITEEKIKKEVKEDHKDKFSDRKHSSNVPDLKPPQSAPVKTKPTPSLLGSSWKNRWGGRLHHYRRPSDVKPREERRPTIHEIAQQKYVMQKINGWKIHYLTAQIEEIAELQKQVHEKFKSTLEIVEAQMQQGRMDDNLEKTNELIKGNMQRSSLISDNMIEARDQLKGIFNHKSHVTDLLQRCSNKRAQKKRDK